MATTYTESLRLWEGTPGDPAIRNAWGTALNENQVLLESAILGTVGVNIGGLTTYSLTTANGAADQARPYIQSYTGVLTANCTVTLPPVPKIGWAQNTTTGGFGVVLTTGGSGTTVTIPPDSTFYWYMVDGSGNVTFPTFTYETLAINTLAISGNATIGGNAAISGTLAVTGTSSFAAPITLPNGVAYSSKDSGGTAHPMLEYNSSNSVVAYSGTNNWALVNAAGTATLFEMSNAGAATFSGGVTVDGGLTVDGGIASGGGVTAATGFGLPNGQAYTGTDSSGTVRPMLEYNSSNSVVAYSGTNNWAIVNSAGTATLFTISNAGTAAFLGGLSTAGGIASGGGVTAATGFGTPNGQAYSGTDAGGTLWPMLEYNSSNSVVAYSGTNNWALLPSGGGTAFIEVSNSTGIAQFTNSPTAPTLSPGDSSTKLATTAFVNPSSSLGNPTSRQNPDGTIDKFGNFPTTLGSTGRYNFVAAFPNICLGVWLEYTSPGSSGYVVHVADFDVNGFDWNFDFWVSTGGGSATTLMWRAVGY